MQCRCFILFYSNTVTAQWNTLFDEDNKPATIYKQYQLPSYKMMMNDDLRCCDLCLLVGKKQRDHRQNN